MSTRRSVLALTPGLVDNPIQIEDVAISNDDGCSSAISSEEDLASIIDEVFGPEQAGAALMALKAQPAPTTPASRPEANLSESQTAPSVGASGDNTPQSGIVK
jgi:hypothetical protein